MSRCEPEDVKEFHALVRRSGEHWMWIGSSEGASRPTWSLPHNRPAPRQFAYWMANDTVPSRCDGYTMPTCGYLLCVRPEHMALVDTAGRRSIVARSSTSPSPRRMPTRGVDRTDDDSLVRIASDEYEKLAPVISDWPGTCVYCGTFATDLDHLLPRTWTGDSVRTIVPTVPACSDCNGALSDVLEPRVFERATLAGSRLRQRWCKTLNAKSWDTDEIAELSGTLRQHVVKMQRHTLRLRERVRVMEMGGLAASVADGGVPLSFRDIGVAS